MKGKGLDVGQEVLDQKTRHKDAEMQTQITEDKKTRWGLTGSRRPADNQRVGTSHYGAHWI